MNKALYGLKQSPKVWYQTLATFLLTLGLQWLETDYSVFFNRQKPLIIAVYVGNLLLFGKSREEIDKVKKALGEKFEMSDLGPVNMYLGMQVLRNR